MLMKKVIIFLSVIICILLQITGCTKQKTDEITKENQKIETEEISTRLYLDYNKVQCVQCSAGGITIPGLSKVLFPENSSKKINNIINLVNSNNGYEEISEQAKSEYFYEKRPPFSINIYMKDKSSYHISQWYTKTPSDIKMSEDKVLLSRWENSKIQYYILSSGKLVDYVTNQSKLDMPQIKQCSYITENINTGKKISDITEGGSNTIVKGGEKLTIIGDGVKSKDVNIVLLNENNRTEKYIISKVKADLGKWNWEGIINESTKTFDGKSIHFKNDKYIVSFESEGIVTCGYCSDIIDMSK